MKELIVALKDFSEQNLARKCTGIRAEVLDKSMEGSYEIQ